MPSSLCFDSEDLRLVGNALLQTGTVGFHPARVISRSDIHTEWALGYRQSFVRNVNLVWAYRMTRVQYAGQESIAGRMEKQEKPTLNQLAGGWRNV